MSLETIVVIAANVLYVIDITEPYFAKGLRNRGNE